MIHKVLIFELWLVALFKQHFLMFLLMEEIHFFFFKTFLWSSSGQWTVGSHIPFIVDVTQWTLERLDELLGVVCEGLDGRSDRPPPQDKECMAVAALNLLNLQVLSPFNY